MEVVALLLQWLFLLVSSKWFSCQCTAKGLLEVYCKTHPFSMQHKVSCNCTTNHLLLACP